ncbi:MAG: transketolase [Planctomycetes bacterium]|nr:transketolase [Planctomycetota bacterium]
MLCNTPSETHLLEHLRTRAACLRKHVLRICAEKGGCHVGGSLSIAEMVAALYFHFMNIDPDDPDKPDRDHFILSKGHCCPTLYAALAERGFFPVEDLMTYQDLDSLFAGHPMLKVPGVEVPTGSLGHGLGVGIGMAVAARADGMPSRVYILMGDGEQQEGSVWESAMAAAHHRVDNLIAIVDRNRLQSGGRTEEFMQIDPLAAKWRAFGWAAREIDGNDMAQVVDALSRIPFEKGKPSAIISNTVKGKGVSFIEDEIGSHYRGLTKEEYERAVREIEEGAE